MLSTIREEDLVSAARERGEQFAEGFRRLAARHPLIGDVRGRGLAMGVDLVRNQNSRQPALRETAKLVYRVFQLGVVVFYVGLHSTYSSSRRRSR